MSHFSVVVCIDDPGKLDAVMAPYDENLETEPYRDYEDGKPAGFWAVKSFREDFGLNPDDATLTWAQIAEVWNREWADDGPLLVGEDGRAYTMSTANPQAKWDYWRIGGRWGGYFPYEPKYARQVMRPESGWDSPGLKPLHCDGGQKCALNLDALREEKADEARKTYAEWTALTDGLPEAKPWSAFVAEVEAKRLDINDARNLYHAQPRIQAISQTDFRWYDDVIGTFGKPEALYVETERARAVPGYATLTLDGRWMAPGRMGWFGMGTDDEGGRIGYWEAANAYIESLPDSTYLIAVDCHI